MPYTFPKKERLKRQKIITRLFSEGEAITVFPLKLMYMATPLPREVSVQAGFSVSGRHFKRAVHRNRIKRLMRETYRLNKATVFNNSTTTYAFMFLYLGRKLPDFHTLHIRMRAVLEKFAEKEGLHQSLKNEP